MVFWDDGLSLDRHLQFLICYSFRMPMLSHLQIALPCQCPDKFRDKGDPMGDLSSRERAILEILVGAYVATGEPIGSRTVSKSRLGLSAATIRNSMSDLEDKGYLCQPHTSAGRVPSDKGYRCQGETGPRTIVQTPARVPVSRLKSFFSRLRPARRPLVMPASSRFPPQR